MSILNRDASSPQDNPARQRAIQDAKRFFQQGNYDMAIDVLEPFADANIRKMQMKIRAKANEASGNDFTMDKAKRDMGTKAKPINPNISYNKELIIALILLWWLTPIGMYYSIKKAGQAKDTPKAPGVLGLRILAWLSWGALALLGMVMLFAVFVAIFSGM